MNKTSCITPYNSLENEIAGTSLHASGNIQILRKINLEQDTRFTQRSVPESLIGLCLDTETTGLDYTQDKVIELGIVAFEYDPATAEIIRVTGTYNGFEDPGFPLAAVTKEITGITDDMVHGQVFDGEQVKLLADQASLVIAHNAAFDRKFVESRFPTFARIPWACTVSQIDWQAERFSTRVLEYLLFKFGRFINAHRALNDAEGVLGILLENLPVSGTPVFRALLETCGKDSSKICAVGAPFDKKNLLKARGYRWNDGTQGSKAWWISVPGDHENAELAWLASEVFPLGILDGVEIQRISAIDRFSVRDF